ncbi:alpha/beta fold hydrolase [Pseudomonas sp. S75]|uniref:alpha/beta fold hydrolase n=1 Tax=unclassified Pseudomonas TaxID=196821 RepID=UPI001908DED1|nr:MULTISPECIES: alpha/beta hydrolase [unclassified Pseudomonas]MBJ9978143.1 alpha/beta fold hydrolase [Pseudomonas sp. S30]MBK0155974.1 alpha/beta fold hydrolase [Pseudomonas sp. S75]
MPLAEIPLCVWRTRGRSFTFRDQNIRYWTAGQGAPLLLLHGFPTASWDWHYLWAPLSQRFRLVACDMLGFGDSAKPTDHHYSLVEQADLQQALLAHLHIVQPVHLLAHDYGACVAQELLARHREARVDIASCVLLNTPLLPELCPLPLVHRLLLSPLGWLVARSFGRHDLVSTVSQVYGPATHPSESVLDDCWSLVLSNRGTRILHKLMTWVPERNRHRQRWLDALQAGEVPLALIQGAVDPLLGAHWVERHRQLLPQADTVLLPGIGHYPHTEAPVQVLGHYLAFRQQPLTSLPQRMVWS